MGAGPEPGRKRKKGVFPEIHGLDSARSEKKR